MSTHHGPQTDRSGFRAWSRARWLVVTMILVALVVAIILIIAFAGGGGSGGAY